MLTRSFTAASLAPDASWRLLRWCRERGATELTVRVLATAGRYSPRADQFEDDFDAAYIGMAERRVLSSGDGTRVQEVRLWRLDDATEAALRRYLAQGLFSQAVDPAGWIEDPIVYRDGELMLGVVTHEQEGVLRVTERELGELEVIGFVFESTSESTDC